MKRRLGLVVLLALAIPGGILAQSVRVGARVTVAGGPGPEYDRGIGGSLSFLFERSTTVDAGFELALLDLGVTEFSSPSPRGAREPYVYFSRNHRRLGLVTLAARFRSPGPGGDFHLAAGTGLYLLATDSESWTEPSQPDIPPGAGTWAAVGETFGVNLGAGFRFARPGWGPAFTLDGRGHLVIGGEDGLLPLFTASAGVEF